MCVTTLRPSAVASPVATNFIPVGLSFADSEHGVLVGDPGGGTVSVFITDDGGTTWRPITP